MTVTGYRRGSYTSYVAPMITALDCHTRVGQLACDVPGPMSSKKRISSVEKIVVEYVVLLNDSGFLAIYTMGLSLGETSGHHWFVVVWYLWVSSGIQF